MDWNSILIMFLFNRMSFRSSNIRSNLLVRMSDYFELHTSLEMLRLSKCIDSRNVILIQLLFFVRTLVRLQVIISFKESLFIKRFLIFSWSAFFVWAACLKKRYGNVLLWAHLFGSYFFMTDAMTIFLSITGSEISDNLN
jgi:hypothetical protein